MDEKPVTATEAAMSREAYDTFEKRLRDSIRLKVAKIMAESVKELVDRIDSEIYTPQEKGERRG